MIHAVVIFGVSFDVSFDGLFRVSFGVSFAVSFRRSPSGGEAGICGAAESFVAESF